MTGLTKPNECLLKNGAHFLSTVIFCKKIAINLQKPLDPKIRGEYHYDYKI